MEKNLYEAIKDRKSYLPEKRVKRWIYQTLKALEYMHRQGIFHRDIKPENILLRNGNVKLADLGSVKSIYSKSPFTEYISTRWYRSPECLLTDGFYNYKMDIWGLGCVFFEMLTLYPLFPGDDEIDQVNKIHKVLGSPSHEQLEKFLVHSQRTEADFPKKLGCGIKKYLHRVSPEAIDLLEKMLCYDPEKRYTAKECLCHEYFRDLVQKEINANKKCLLISKKINCLNSISNISFNKSYFDKNDEQHQSDKNIIKSTEKDQSKKKKTLRRSLYLPEITTTKYNSKNNRYTNLNSINKFDEKEEDEYMHLITYRKLPKLSMAFAKKTVAKETLGHFNIAKNTMSRLNEGFLMDSYIKLGYKHGKEKSKGKKYVSPYSKIMISNHIKI